MIEALPWACVAALSLSYVVASVRLTARALDHRERYERMFAALEPVANAIRQQDEARAKAARGSQPRGQA